MITRRISETCKLGMVIAVCLAGPIALAQDVVIDQQNILSNRLHLFWRPGPFDPPPGGTAGQTVIATLDSLNFVDLMIRNVSATGAATFRLFLHDGTLGGAIFALSDVTLQGQPAEWTRFEFGGGGGLRILAGFPHTLELHQLDGSEGWGIAYTTASSGYTNGSAYLDGLLTTNVLAFREGAIVPRLSVLPSGQGEIRLLWPTNFEGYYHEYVLESAVSLDSAVWTRATNEVGVAGGFFCARAAAAASQRFFRLHKKWSF